MARALTINNWTANTAIGALEKSNEEFIHTICSEDRRDGDRQRDPNRQAVLHAASEDSQGEEEPRSSERLTRDKSVSERVEDAAQGTALWNRGAMTTVRVALAGICG